MYKNAFFVIYCWKEWSIHVNIDEYQINRLFNIIHLSISWDRYSPPTTNTHKISLGLWLLSNNLQFSSFLILCSQVRRWLSLQKLPPVPLLSIHLGHPNQNLHRVTMESRTSCSPYPPARALYQAARPSAINDRTNKRTQTLYGGGGWCRMWLMWSRFPQQMALSTTMTNEYFLQDGGPSILGITDTDNMGHTQRIITAKTQLLWRMWNLIITYIIIFNEFNIMRP